eukprot:m.7375 g.7375  ORF g.7375 m.7375 type:complete len:1063 (+) comp3704_c0_seq2:262-3450(+)
MMEGLDAVDTQKVSLLKRLLPEISDSTASRLLALHHGDLEESLKNAGAFSNNGAEPGWDRAVSLVVAILGVTEVQATSLLGDIGDLSNEGKVAAAVAHVADNYFAHNSAKMNTRTPVTPPRQKSKNMHRYFGVSVVDLISSSTNNEGSLPRLVVYLCEYLLSRCSLKTHNVLDDVFSMIHDPLDNELFKTARECFNRGDFYDCGSPVVMFRLLKAFIRELPQPLIPRSKHDGAIDISRHHMRSVVTALESNKHFNVFLQGLCREDDEPELRSWINSLWGPSSMNSEAHLRHACDQVNKVVEGAALSTWNSPGDLAEFFFELPKVNRDVLEYLAVCFVKIDLMARKGKAGVPLMIGNSEEHHSALYALACTFAPHILKPAVWNVGGDAAKKARRQKLQLFFFILFLFFVKRKHNLMTAEERTMLESDDMLDQIILSMSAAHSKFSKAFESALGRSSPGSEAASVTSPVDSRCTTPEPLVDGVNTAPFVQRQFIQKVVEVELDMDPLVAPQETWSNYAESGDEVIGLSPSNSPCMARRQVVLHDVSEKLDQSSLEASGLNNGMVGYNGISQVLCTWEETEEDVAIREESLSECPNLSRWLVEHFLPFDHEAQSDFFVLERLSNSSVFDAGLKENAEQVNSKSPGSGLLGLLGDNFAPHPTGEESRLNLLRNVLRPSPWMLKRILSNSSLGGVKEVSAPAINYDYALSFPRTYADVATRPAPLDVVERFLSYPRRVAKTEYDADVEYGLLNHSLPKIPDYNSMEVCDSCKIHFGGFFSTSKQHKTHCRYCARLLCKSCCDRKFVLPSYILQKGDFEAHAICQPCENHLQKHLHAACIELDRLSPVAIKVFGNNRISQLKATRQEGLRYLFYHILPDCPSRHTLVCLIPQNCAPYLSVFPDSVGARVSLTDLCELQTRQSQKSLETVVKLFRNHVGDCPHCSVVSRFCGAKNYCKQGRDLSCISENDESFGGNRSMDYESLGQHSISPFGGTLARDDEMVLCRTCSSFCHKECYMPNEGQCSLCVNETPDVMPFVRHSSEGNLRPFTSSPTTNQFLWELCDIDHFN